MSQRIVSLLPAATEIAAVLGLEGRLVGRSHECDVPETVVALPVLTAPRVDPGASSREIHEQVGRALAAGGSASPDAAAGDRAPGGVLYTLDADRLAALEPDLILTQAACDVCAISAADVATAVRRCRQPPRVVALAPARLADLFQDLLTVGAATGTIGRAREVVARLRARVASLACRVQPRPAGPAARPRVAVIEWLDPPMAAGNWVPELVRLAGGDDVLGRAGRHSHWVSWDEVAAADPDVVVLVPCGFPLDRVVAEARSAAVWPHVAGLRASRAGRVWAVDGHHLFNRPGPRLIDSLERLAEILHPGRFAFAASRPFVRRLEP